MVCAVKVGSVLLLAPGITMASSSLRVVAAEAQLAVGVHSVGGCHPNGGRAARKRKGVGSKHINCIAVAGEQRWSTTEDWGAQGF